MIAEIAIDSPDGVRHTAKVFQAHRDDAPVVLCLPAMGVAADYYEPFGEGIARMGAGTAVLLDLRRQGRSSASARRGDDFGYCEILELDLPAAVEVLARRRAACRMSLAATPTTDPPADHDPCPTR